MYVMNLIIEKCMCDVELARNLAEYSTHEFQTTRGMYKLKERLKMVVPYIL